MREKKGIYVGNESLPSFKNNAVFQFKNQQNNIYPLENDACAFASEAFSSSPSPHPSFHLPGSRAPRLSLPSLPTQFNPQQASYDLNL